MAADRCWPPEARAASSTSMFSDARLIARRTSAGRKIGKECHPSARRKDASTSARSGEASCEPRSSVVTQKRIAAGFEKDRRPNRSRFAVSRTRDRGSTSSRVSASRDGSRRTHPGRRGRALRSRRQRGRTASTSASPSPRPQWRTVTRGMGPQTHHTAPSLYCASWTGNERSFFRTARNTEPSAPRSPDVPDRFGRDR